MQLAQRVQKEDVTQEELEVVQKELSDEFDKLMQYSVISDFITARKELDAGFGAGKQRNFVLCNG